MRRKPQTNQRFIRNISESHLEVHDLDNEKEECQIDEIINAGNAYYIFISNTELALERWLSENSLYDGCGHCLPQYHRK